MCHTPFHNRYKNMDVPVLLFLVCFLFSSAFGCNRCVHQSKAAYFSSNSALTVGACGYGSSALALHGRYIGGGSSALFRQGVGCGACFKIRCKNRKICSNSGVKVVLTDLINSNQTDFVLSKNAFASMAKKGLGQQVLNYGILDIEYKRIPCVYKHHNLSLRVEEHSKKPNYLAIKFLYQGGQTDIVGVDVAEVGKSNWRFMSRDYGAVWSTSRTPTGPLQFRMVVTDGYDGKDVWAKKEVLPADWKAGVVYDSGVQINEVAQEACSPCDNSTWI